VGSQTIPGFAFPTTEPTRSLSYTAELLGYRLDVHSSPVENPHRMTPAEANRAAQAAFAREIAPRIDAGEPVIVQFANHLVVVYGYTRETAANGTVQYTAIYEDPRAEGFVPPKGIVYYGNGPGTRMPIADWVDPDKRLLWQNMGFNVLTVAREADPPTAAPWRKAFQNAPAIIRGGEEVQAGTTAYTGLVGIERYKKDLPALLATGPAYAANDTMALAVDARRKAAATMRAHADEVGSDADAQHVRAAAKALDEAATAYERARRILPDVSAPRRAVPQKDIQQVQALLDVAIAAEKRAAAELSRLD
jgi:hypothetical protein